MIVVNSILRLTKVYVAMFCNAFSESKVLADLLRRKDLSLFNWYFISN